MADIDIANLCYAVLEHEMDRHREVILEGKCSDFAHYRYLTGKLHALEAAEEGIKEAFRKRYDDEDE